MTIDSNLLNLDDYARYSMAPDVENSIDLVLLKEIKNIFAICSGLFLVDLIQSDDLYVNGPDDDAFVDNDRLRMLILTPNIQKSEKIAYAKRISYLQDKPTPKGRAKIFCSRFVRLVLFAPKILIASVIAISILFKKNQEDRLFLKRKIADVISYIPPILRNGKRSLDELNELISSLEKNQESKQK
ncbi:MAG: hypothetical protein KGQ54_01145 [Verrucomicrobia bacterium]|nr:hypothetical protein [Verrucomicrobiota bacterium]